MEEHNSTLVPAIETAQADSEPLTVGSGVPQAAWAEPLILHRSKTVSPVSA